MAENTPKPEGDPAEFLLSNAKYHDCHLTVGDPATGDVERIGVSSTHLIAHSSVFRDMLAESALADPTGRNTHIKDVSPATFKLMLRHVYGAKLPRMAPEEAADLALCADKYNIQRLVGKAAKRLTPTSAADVFTALACAAYISCPSLELKISKIVQQKTDQIVKNPKFLQLDENCLLFIVKQATLNISELELWNNVLRWAENQVKLHPQQKLRNFLNKILKHVRLLSLTSNEIVDYVLPKNVLTPEEFMDLTLAVSKKQVLKSPALCNLLQKRGLVVVEPVKTFTFNNCAFWSNVKLELFEAKPFSTFTIKPKVDVTIDTLTVKSIDIKPNNEYLLRAFPLSCNINIYKSSSGVQIEYECVSMKLNAVPNENIALQVKKSYNQPLILKARETYQCVIQMTPPLPVHKLYYIPYHEEVYYTDYTEKIIDGSHFTLKFEDPFHILNFVYSIE